MPSRVVLFMPQLVAACSPSGTVYAWSCVSTSNGKTVSVTQTAAQTAGSKFIMLGFGHAGGFAEGALFGHNSGRRLSIWTTGTALAGGGFNLPIYQIVAWQSPTISNADIATVGAITTDGCTLSAATSDGHAPDGSDWTSRVETQLDISYANVAAHMPMFLGCAMFGLEVQLPYSVGGASMQIESISAVLD